MREFFKYGLWLLLILIFYGQGVAQTYVIPDANFRKYLADNHGSLLNASQELIISNAKAYSGDLSCAGLNISDLSGLQYFHNIKLINCSNNKLNSLPSLDSLKKLELFWINGNQLTSFPRINHIKTLTTLNVKNNLLTQLPSLEGMTALQSLDCSLNKLNALPELNTLTGLEILYAYTNALTTIPYINNLGNLKVLNIQSNKVTRLPDISQNTQLSYIEIDHNLIDSLPPLSHLPLLESLTFWDNKIKAMPDLSKNTKLVKIDARKNQLSNFPNISTITTLANVLLQNNQLTFKDILPLTAHSQYATVFKINPQDTINATSTLTVPRGDSLIIDLGLDESVSGSTYQWEKDGLNILSTAIPSLIYPQAEKNHGGIYSCSITNNHPLLSSITLNVRSAMVVVYPCINISFLNYEILNSDCAKGSVIKIDDSQISGVTYPLNYQLIPLQNQKALSSTSSTIPNIMPGSYSLSINDASQCGVTLHNYIYIPSPTGCMESFTPNGDGLEDTFYIRGQGQAKVYNKEGVLIRSLQAPTHWDGTDATGKISPMGYYLIVVDEKDKTGVVLIE